MQTDNLRRLEYAKLEPIDQTIKLFVGIYGVGFEKAQAWAAAGHRTLQDILEKEKLSECQRIGIEHYEDFNSRIPREEVEKHGELVIVCAKEIDPKLNVQIMGSFRRVSGSIPFLKSQPLISQRVQVLAVISTS